MTTDIDCGQATLTELATRAQPDHGIPPLDRLTALRILEAAVVVERAACVAQAREEGATWRAIGESLGVTKQAASNKFGPKPSPDPSEETAPRKQKATQRAGAAGWDVRTVGGLRIMSIVPRAKTVRADALPHALAMARSATRTASGLLRTRH
jgi:hypothetical protein